MPYLLPVSAGYIIVLAGHHAGSLCRMEEEVKHN